jgi:hypothetical protein
MVFAFGFLAYGFVPQGWAAIVNLTSINFCIIAQKCMVGFAQQYGHGGNRFEQYGAVVAVGPGCFERDGFVVVGFAHACQRRTGGGGARQG